MPVVINGSTGISGNDGTAAVPTIQGTDTNTGMFFPAADQIAFAEGGVEAMRLDASGNVGIGTTTPAAKLDVVGTARVGSGSSTGGVLRVTSTGQFADVITATASVTGALFSDNTNARAVVGTVTNHPLVFFVNNGEQGRFTTTGALQVGNNAGTNTAYSPDRINFNAGNYFVLNQSSVGVVLPNGNTSWSAQSDERLKDIIEPIENAASKVASLRPIIGRYKTDEPTKRRAFLIAQDVQAVLPEAVTEDDQGYLLLAYTELVPLLTAALQEALNEIAALKARVAALEATP